MAIVLPLSAREHLLPSSTLSILELIAFTLPIQNSKFTPSNIEQFFDTSAPSETDLSQIQSISVPSSDVVFSLHRYIIQKEKNLPYKSVRSIHSTVSPEKTYPLWIIQYWVEYQTLHPIQDSWKKAESYLQGCLNKWRRKGYQRGITAVGQIFDALGTTKWGGRLRGFSKNAVEDLDNLTFWASKRWLRGAHVNQMLDLLRQRLVQKRKACDILFSYAFDTMKKGFSEQEKYKEGISYKYLRVVGDDLATGKLHSVAMIINLDRSHWVAAIVDGEKRKLHYGDSLGQPLAKSTGQILNWWIAHHVGMDFELCTLPITIQEDTISCGLLAWNALVHFFEDEELISPCDVAVGRLCVMHRIIQHHLAHMSSAQDESETSDWEENESALISPPYVPKDAVITPEVAAELPSPPPLAMTAEVATELPSPPPSGTTETNTIGTSSSSTSPAPQNSGLLRWFTKATKKEQDEYFAREDERHRAIQEDEEHISQHLQELKVENKKEYARLRKRRWRAAKQAEEVKQGLRDENGVKRRIIKVQLIDTQSGHGKSMAELTRPARALKSKFKSENRKNAGRKLKNQPSEAKYHNWFSPVTWSLIEKAAKNAGWEMSPTKIVKEAKKIDSRIFEGLSRSTVSDWIDRSNGKPRWKVEVSRRIMQGNQPGHSRGGQPGLLSKHSDVVEAIKKRLLSLRKADAPLTVVSIRGIILATITVMRPRILDVHFHDGSTFKASDSFVRSWIKKELNWSIRKATRSAQKIPSNWEDLCEKSTFRKVYSIKEYDIPSGLYVNSDQTQAVYAPGNKLTYANTGDKQVSLVGGDEKRAFTIMVSVSNDGTLLPFQAIYEGKTKASLPSSTSPHYKDIVNVGMILEFSGTTTYWSNMKTMKSFVSNILDPYFCRVRQELRLPSTQKALWQIDVWSVHRSTEFREWMRENYPNIILDYVPGGCTGLHQPCDVGIQRPLKQSLTRSFHETVVQDMVQSLNAGEEIPAYDKRIATLRNRSITWLWNAYRAVNNPALIRKSFELCRVRNWNLSFDSLTSFEAREKLRNTRTSDPTFWEELSAARADTTLPAESDVVDEDLEFTDQGRDALCDDSSFSVADVINEVLMTGEDKKIEKKPLVPSNLAEDDEAEPIENPDTWGTATPSEGDTGTVNPPQPSTARRDQPETSVALGKRKRTANKLYPLKNFIHHDDNEASDCED